MVRRSPETDWSPWLARWDAQQEMFLPDREARFARIFDLAEASLGRRFSALDLGCGPGSLSVRLLRRFPSARVCAVDYDPVTLRIGQGALGSQGGRLRWIDAQLGSAGFPAALPARRFDAAFSTSALHWLKAPALGRLYSDLARILRPGGIVLNADLLPFGPAERDLQRLSRRTRKVRDRSAAAGAPWKGWEKWWADAERLPALRAEFQERTRRRAEHPHHATPPWEVHVRALRRAGFRRVAALWNDLDDRVLYARR